MTGITIDHLVSLTAFFAATLLFTSLFLQTMNTAIIYQRNHQVALKASDVLNNILLSPGSPSDWGQNNGIPSAFGIHQPETSLLSLSSFSLLRLISPQNVLDYSGTLYGNISVAEGVSVFMPVANYVDYPTVSRLIGVNGSYGFHVLIEPTLKVSISQVQQYPLRLKVQVEGPGSACSGAVVDCSIFYAFKSQPTPSIEIQTDDTFADSTGVGFLEFQTVNASEVSYSAMAQVYLGGLRGTGFYCSQLSSDSFIKTLVTDYENRTIALVHRGDLLGIPPNSAVHYNLTYVLPTQNYGFRSIQIENSTGIVNQGNPVYVKIPSFDVGILIISYRTTGEDFGTIMMPWGVSSLGMSVDFGIDSSTSSWVATQLRQVIVGQISYQVRLALWSLTS
jgi:hypothetical protein